MTAILEQMRTSEVTEEAQSVIDRWRFIHDVWSNAVESAEAGRERKELLGLTYEEIEAGCAQLDQRQAWHDKLQSLQSQVAAEAKAQQSLDALDAEFQKLQAEYAAKRAPIAAIVTAAGGASYKAVILKNNLQKHLLPHIAARRVEIESQHRAACAQVAKAREAMTIAEAREASLQAAIDRAAKSLDDHRYSTPAGKQRLESEKLSVEQKLSEHQAANLTTARNRLAEAQAAAAEIDRNMATLLNGPALEVWAD